jgi:hypothetical protein
VQILQTVNPTRLLASATESNELQVQEFKPTHNSQQSLGLIACWNWMLILCDSGAHGWLIFLPDRMNHVSISLLPMHPVSGEGVPHSSMQHTVFCYLMGVQMADIEVLKWPGRF